MNGLQLSSRHASAPPMGAPIEQAEPQPLVNGLGVQTPRANPYTPQQKPMQNGLLQSAISGFQRGFDPEGYAADQERSKAEGVDKVKKLRALALQQRQLPEQQRVQWWQQNAPVVSQIMGQDLSQQPIDPADFTDQAMDGHIAALNAQLGEEPARPQGVNLGGGAFAEYGPNGLRVLREPTPEPVKKDYVAQEFGGKVWMVNKNDPNDKYEMGRPNPTASASNQDSFRPATPEELKAYGIPEGTAVKINTRTGEPHVVSGAKPASEYTVKQQNDFLKAAQTTDALEGAVNQYEQLVDEFKPQLWTTGIGGDNPTAKKLDAARTNVDIQIKELFNLGVLNGPDLDIIRGAIPDATGFDALGKSAKSVKASLGVVHDYINRARNQIPAEYVAKARPNGNPTGSETKGAAADWLSKISGGAQQPAQGAQQAPQPAQADTNIHPAIAKAIDDAFGPDEDEPGEVPVGVTQTSRVTATNPQTGEQIELDPDTGQWRRVN